MGFAANTTEGKYWEVWSAVFPPTPYFRSTQRLLVVTDILRQPIVPPSRAKKSEKNLLGQLDP